MASIRTAVARLGEDEREDTHALPRWYVHGLYAERHFQMKQSTQWPAYAELQTTTNFSFLRGGSHGEELVATAKALGLSGLAITDRNTLAGVVRAHAAAKEAGLRLIAGARLDLTAPLGMENAPDQDQRLDVHTPPSLLCLPTDRAAYGRLSQLLTLGQRRAGKGQCTLFIEDVVAHSAGQILIALPPLDWDWRASLHAPRSDDASCLTEAFAHHLRTLRAALDNQASSPKARLYLAASHTYRGDDRARIAALAHLAEACGTPLVATGDVLYHAPHRRPLQDVLTCIREKCTLAEAGFRLQANAERHLKSPAEMARLFAGPRGRARPHGSRSRAPAASPSTNSSTSIPTSRCHPARRRNRIWKR